MRRRVGVAGALACAVAALAASAAAADKAPRPDPSELWRAYPLEQKPSTVAKPLAASGTAQRQGNAASPRQTSASSDGQSSSGPSAALIAGVVAAAALIVLAATALRRRRRDAAPTPVPATRAAPRAGPAPAPPTAPRVVPEPQPPPAAPVPAPAPSAQRTAPPAAAPVWHAAERAGPRRPPATSSKNGRAAAARTSPVCQIHWDRRRRTFYAVSVDGNGIGHMVASSRRLESLRPGPPEETPETRAVIRRLAKELRNKGWRPLRAKGIDFEERRWYARRFRWPTEAELAEATEAEHAEAAGTEPLEADEVTDRSGGTR
jgi:hypothetical protein